MWPRQGVLFWFVFPRAGPRNKVGHSVRHPEPQVLVSSVRGPYGLKRERERLIVYQRNDSDMYLWLKREREIDCVSQE